MSAVEAYRLCCEWNIENVICRTAMGFFVILFSDYITLRRGRVMEDIKGNKEIL